MCLAVKYDRVFKGNTGWKLLRKRERGYYTGICEAKCRKISDSEFTDMGGCINSHFHASDGTPYPTGSHIFTKRLDAEKVRKLCFSPRSQHNLVLRKVAFKEQVAYGEVDWYSDACTHGYSQYLTTTVVVAKKCRVLYAPRERR